MNDREQKKPPFRSSRRRDRTSEKKKEKVAVEVVGEDGNNWVWVVFVLSGGLARVPFESMPLSIPVPPRENGIYPIHIPKTLFFFPSDSWSISFPCTICCKWMCEGKQAQKHYQPELVPL